MKRKALTLRTDQQLAHAEKTFDGVGVEYVVERDVGTVGRTMLGGLVRDLGNGKTEVLCPESYVGDVDELDELTEYHRECHEEVTGER